MKAFVKTTRGARSLISKITKVGLYMADDVKGIKRLRQKM